jgi:hypothetical protein
MSGNLFFAAAVAAGLGLLATVAWSYLNPRPGQRASVTSLLGVLGFALVASPNWTSISIKSEGLELSLIRELQARQLAILSELRVTEARPADPDPPQRAAEPRAKPAPTEPTRDQPTQPRKTAPDEVPRVIARAPALSPERIEQLFLAFERGELRLSQLSDSELLALSQQIGARGRAD